MRQGPSVNLLQMEAVADEKGEEHAEQEGYTLHCQRLT